MQFLAIYILSLLLSIKSATAQLVSPTTGGVRVNGESLCGDNLGGSCSESGSILCCTETGFLYCGWTDKTYVHSSCPSSKPNCGVADDGSTFCSPTSLLPDSNIGRQGISHVSNTGAVVGTELDGVAWNVLDSSGNEGAVP